MKKAFEREFLKVGIYIYKMFLLSYQSIFVINKLCIHVIIITVIKVLKEKLILLFLACFKKSFLFSFISTHQIYNTFAKMHLYSLYRLEKSTDDIENFSQRYFLLCHDAAFIYGRIRIESISL